MIELITALAVLFNVVVILTKYDKGYVSNAAMDAALLIGVIMLFKGSTQLLVIGAISSALISVYLSVLPPKFLRKETHD